VLKEKREKNQWKPPPYPHLDKKKRRRGAGGLKCLNPERKGEKGGKINGCVTPIYLEGKMRRKQDLSGLRDGGEEERGGLAPLFPRRGKGKGGVPMGIESSIGGGEEHTLTICFWEGRKGHIVGAK